MLGMARNWRSRAVGRRKKGVLWIEADNSILRVFFWFGDRYALSLLFQSILMIAVQVPLNKFRTDIDIVVYATEDVSGLSPKSFNIKY